MRHFHTTRHIKFSHLNIKLIFQPVNTEKLNNNNNVFISFSAVATEIIWINVFVLEAGFQESIFKNIMLLKYSILSDSQLRPIDLIMKNVYK